MRSSRPLERERCRPYLVAYSIADLPPNLISSSHQFDVEAILYLQVGPLRLVRATAFGRTQDLSNQVRTARTRSMSVAECSIFRPTDLIQVAVVVLENDHGKA